MKIVTKQPLQLMVILNKLYQHLQRKNNLLPPMPLKQQPVIALLTLLTHLILVKIMRKNLLLVLQPTP
ncbi:hypothetical protein Aasi_1650 [Candidatus Amoebophilus asiaticus 5a2]|uniref:Uncharacterized protein n=1 Tax=Amoebophilus asiaticus (strain 5a2) TaxID=452471 RepID=C3L3R8_AMOA5|nr:hypothetical protein Aasi_1650 [Candidatus Amoebophilus asiaticus 5a2]